MGLKLQNTVNAENKEKPGWLKTTPWRHSLASRDMARRNRLGRELTRQAHRTDVADLDEVAVAEAGGPVVHVNWGREG